MNKLEINMACTGQGKSFALIDSVVESVGKKILFISLEMQKEMIEKRIAIAAEMKGVKVEDIDVEIICFPTRSANWDMIKKELHNSADYDMLMVDYLDLMSIRVDGTGSMYDLQYKNIVSMLSVDIPVITASQLPRNFHNENTIDYYNLYKDQLSRTLFYRVKKEGRKVVKDNLRTSEKTEVIDLDKFQEKYEQIFNK